MMRRLILKVGLYFIKKGGGEMYMIPIYIGLLQLDPNYKFEDIPQNMQEHVAERLEVLGLDKDGKPIRK